MPFVITQAPVIQANLAQAILAALSTVPGAALLTAPKCRLYQAGPGAPTPYQVVADFTECTFDGYAAAVLGALAGPVNLLDKSQGVHAEANFASANPQTVPQNVKGYYITNTAGTVLYMAEAFASPIPITRPGDFLSLDVMFASAEYPPASAG